MPPPQVARVHLNASQAQTQRVADATVEAFTAAVFGRFLVTDADHGNDPRVQGTPEFANCSISGKNH